MREFGLFSHWTFEAFAPGSIPRVKYNAFRDIHRQSAYCFSQLARFDELVTGDRVVDWCTVSKLTSRLILSIRKLVDLLQLMNPVEFMDAHDWFAKLGFYARMSVEHAAIPATPPYVLDAEQLGPDHPLAWVRARLPRKSGPGLVIPPSLYQFLVEANDLRPQLDVLLRQLDLADEALVEAASEKIVTMILAAHLPERLRAELEIEAMELAPGGGLLELRIFVGSGAEAELVGRVRRVRAADFFPAWLAAVSCKFSPAALTLRLNLGLADEEHPLTVLVGPDDGSEGESSCDLWEGEPDSGALVQRMAQIVPRVSQLHVFRAQGEALRPEQCRSLHDLVCLCLERGLSQIFAFAGEPSRGLAGIKQMRLEIPVVINTFNLGGGLFPTAAERAVISMEDVRSVPAWSFLLGLVSPAVSWPHPAHADAPHGEVSPMPHYSSYAVLSQFFMHCTLRLEQNLYAVECRCEDGQPLYIHFRCMFWGASLTERVRRVEIVRAILEGEGFGVDARGNYLVATRTCEQDVHLQRSLVSLGMLVSWLQVGGSSLSAMEAGEGARAFGDLQSQSRSNPL